MLGGWRERAANVTGQALLNGHFLPEEVSDETYAELKLFPASWPRVNIDVRGAGVYPRYATGEDINMTATEGFVVPADGGKHLDMTTPGRFAALKLLGHETNESIMLFEETAPPGTETTLHLHHHSDEVAYVLSGEVTFKIGDQVTVGRPGACAFMPRGVAHAWKNAGAGTCRVLFLYTPAPAGKFFEELLTRPAVEINGDEANEIRRRHGWEVVGPPPL